MSLFFRTVPEAVFWTAIVVIGTTVAASQEWERPPGPSARFLMEQHDCFEGMRHAHVLDTQENRNIYCGPAMILLHVQAFGLRDQ